MLPKIPLEFLNHQKKIMTYFSSIKKVFENKTLLVLIWIAIVKSLVAMTYTFFMPFVLKEYHYSVVQIGLWYKQFFTPRRLRFFSRRKIVKQIRQEKLLLYLCVAYSAFDSGFYVPA
jgi:hypothetical protein